MNQNLMSVDDFIISSEGKTFMSESAILINVLSAQWIQVEAAVKNSIDNLGQKLENNDLPKPCDQEHSFKERYLHLLPKEERDDDIEKIQENRWADPGVD